MALSDTLLNLLQGGANLGLMEKFIGDVRTAGTQQQQGINSLMNTVRSDLTFKPYTVTSATGGFTTGPEGGSSTLAPELQQMMSRLQEGAGMFYNRGLADTGDRAAQITAQMEAALAPQRERERLALEERLLGQGRLGVSTAAYGGTPEQLALSKAIEEQRAVNAVNARNQAMSAETKAIWTRAAMIRKENELAAQNRSAAAQVRAIQADAFRATPAGQFAAFRDTGRNLEDAKRLLAGTNPETQAVKWLELNATVGRLTEEMETLNNSTVGKLASFMKAAPDRLAAFLRPAAGSRAGSSMPALGTLPGSPILADALSRQGLFSGGGRSNPLTGLAEQKLTSIDSTAKEQVRILGGIWRSITTGNLGGLAP